MVNKQPKNAEPDREKLTFEEALSRLDETVQALEAGGLTLNEATARFEEGMKLARLCSEMLAAAELRISRIQTAYGEQMRLPSEEEDSGSVEEEGSSQ
ncbi:MAG: exodeoxyribonuclease VII small subunit [SAR202 cluster bacterium]|jgi:exodeoxyribonuclease VII small subunit|nr:exodeoxyribonuclease VII small subunit [SAR202 cluster bacterium]